MRLRSAPGPDVDKAVAAATRVRSYSQTSREDRVALLTKIVEVYKGRMKRSAPPSPTDGAPLPMAEKLQAGAGLGHIMSTLEVLKNHPFEETLPSAVVMRAGRRGRPSPLGTGR
jgi:aldehyde dehydrogenase (NAD+)